MAFRINRSGGLTMNSGSSYEKVVKLACKPKAAPPKAKYLDPIVAATWADDGAVHDVCRALSPRLREPNSIIVFKALIVLHTMIRNGSTDNVLSYLSSSDVLRLRNVTDAPWEGYTTPENLKSYAIYMETRIKAYANLKHDAIRVQSESNRDHRATTTNEDGRLATNGASISRSKTIAGRKLRIMTVEKGLLRETKIVQKMIASLLACKFYLDNLEDELVITAFRLLVKDLLVLFQALNEGVINVLEHYFEMSHVDAAAALSIYRHFCDQTKDVVEYLAVAKKLQNLLNVPVPNLKHAPVSLAGALEEYLNDPNFEQNRIEYRANKAVVDRPPNKSSSTTSRNTSTPAPSSKPAVHKDKKEEGQVKVTSASASDFFSSIEQEQHTMFNPQTGSPSVAYFQQQAGYNPFTQRQSALFTGSSSPFAQQAQTNIPVFQNTGAPGPFLQPQATGLFQPQVHFQPTGFLQPQSTGFLQPQPTGSNPFRQSVLVPQTTGFPSFGAASVGLTSAFPQASSSSQSYSTPQFAQQTTPFPLHSNYPSIGGSAPARPQSTPIPSLQETALKPLVAHQTGSKNPFGIPTTPAPPVPKMPTLQELATGAFRPLSPPNNNFQGLTQSPVSSNPPGSTSIGMSSVASSFSASTGPTPGELVSTPAVSPFPSSFSQATTSTTSGFNPPSSILKSQPTGLSGITPFKPSSSFGASLLESLPSVSSANTSSAVPEGLPSHSLPSPHQAASSFSGLPPFSGAFGSLNSRNASTLPSISETGTIGNFLMPGSGATANVERGLRPQLTGAPNPFRASVIGIPGGSPTQTSLGFGSGQLQNTAAAFQPLSSFGQNQLNATDSLNSNNAGTSASNPSGQQQPPRNTLISFG